MKNMHLDRATPCVRWTSARGMSRALVLGGLGALAIAGLAAYVLWAGRPGPPSDPEALAGRISADERLRKLIEERLAAGDTAGARAAIEDRIVTLLAQREQLDATIWAEERLGQRYEITFVTLWDNLRAAAARLRPEATSAPPKPLAEAPEAASQLDVIANFELSQIKIGDPGAARPLPEGIQIARLDRSARTLSREDWQAFLNRLKAEGFELIQSEWHHAVFEQDAAGRRVSTFNIVLHGANARRDERYEITGPLDITWSDRRDALGQMIPDVIDATGLTVKWRRGRPAFTGVVLAEFPFSVRDFDNVIAYDLNEDGLTDIVYPPLNLVFWNRGSGQFDRQTLLVQPPAKAYQGVVADFTGDGRIDYLLSAALEPPRSAQYGLFLYEGQGAGRFAMVAALVIDPAAVEPKIPATFAVADIERDGDLDLFIGQYKNAYKDGNFPNPYFDANDGYPAYLLVNDGTARFTDVTEAAGLAAKRFRRSYRASFADLDEDTDLDLLVVNDFAGDVYFGDGHGRFTDVTASAVDVATNFGMSHTFGDFNTDGRLDFYVTGMASTTARRLERMGLVREDQPEHTEKRTEIAYGNRMYLADVAGRSRQPSFKDNVARSGWTWGVATLDFNNDGFPDIYAANGHVSGTTAKDYCTRFWTHDIYSGGKEDLAQMMVFQVEQDVMSQEGMSWNGFEHDYLFMNLAGQDFTNVSFLMGVALEQDTRASIGDDFDLDGRMDLLVTTDGYQPTNEPPKLHVFFNRGSFDRHWIGVRLGATPGISPLGSHITVAYQGGRQVGTIVTGDSFMAQHPAAKHFGLGGTDKVDYIEVRWPNGKVTRLDNPRVDRYHTLTP